MKKGVPLRLDRYIPWRDVRQKIWAYLEPGDIELVKCAQNSQRKQHITIHHATKYAERGYINVLRWLHKRGRFDWRIWSCAHILCVYSVLGGQLKTLIWLIQKGYVADIRQLLYGCAKTGNIEIFEWLCKNLVKRELSDKNILREIFRCAINSEQIVFLDWLNTKNQLNLIKDGLF